MQLLIKPGLALQGLTTREPDESMLEVAAAALKRLLELENMVTEPENGTIPIDSLASAADS